MIVALTGGVGGAKLVKGIAALLRPSELLVVGNTGDDFTHLGLHVSPDLDSVMYALAGRANQELGWGLQGETWNFMAALERLGQETWFSLGDADLATHVHRTLQLSQGRSLSEVSLDLAERFGVRHRIVPMSDDPVRTLVRTDVGLLAFQDYFVKRKCMPKVEEIIYDGAARALPSPSFRSALQSAELRAVVICPSNPFLSIEPILSVAGVREALVKLAVPKIAVSPIVGGAAVKGPTAKIMSELGLRVSAVQVARHYAGLLNGYLCDVRDADDRADIERMNIRCHVTDTLMSSPEACAAVARAVLALIDELAAS